MVNYRCNLRRRQSSSFAWRQSGRAAASVAGLVLVGLAGTSRSAHQSPYRNPYSWNLAKPKHRGPVFPFAAQKGSPPAIPLKGWAGFSHTWWCTGAGPCWNLGGLLLAVLDLLDDRKSSIVCVLLFWVMDREEVGLLPSLPRELRVRPINVATSARFL